MGNFFCDCIDRNVRTLVIIAEADRRLFNELNEWYGQGPGEDSPDPWPALPKESTDCFAVNRLKTMQMDRKCVRKAKERLSNAVYLVTHRGFDQSQRNILFLAPDGLVTPRLCLAVPVSPLCPKMPHWGISLTVRPSRVRIPEKHKKPRERHKAFLPIFGDPSGIRTPDTLIKRALKRSLSSFAQL